MRTHLPAAVAAFSLIAAPAGAQIRASELQSVAQTVDGTTVRITYSRPRLRGRTEVFGTKAVQWGEVWTPGANWATLLETDRDITIGGTRVPKGKYGVWMVVSQDSSWTVLLDPKWRQFHMDHPKPNDTQIQVKARATANAPTIEEALTFSFPAVTARGATIAMQWARMRVSMDYQVTPTLTELLPETDARPYLGTYALDSAGTAVGRMIVSYDRGGLKARFDPADNYMKTFALMRTGKDVFTAGLYEAAEVYAGGEIYEVLKPDMMFTFSLVNGTMTFECRGEDDALLFSGRRQR
jgi:hypothetical protein